MTLVKAPETFPVDEGTGVEALVDDRIPRLAWQLLFDLYARESNGRTTELCNLLSTAQISNQAAQRYVDLLIDLKLIDLAPAPGRRFRLVSLSPEGFAALQVKMRAKGA